MIGGRMLRQRLRGAFEKNRNEFLGVVLRRYPRFVRDDRVTVLPRPQAFCFHDVRKDEMDAVVEFLSANGYRTLTADEYLERREGSGNGGREIVLTFDDGLRSLYEIVWPLLRSHGLRAVAYVVTGLVPEADRAHSGDERGRLLCSWEELRQMHASGVVDVQSHSRFHHRIAVSSRVLDFARPGLSGNYSRGYLAPMAGRLGGGGAPEDLPLGAPIHPWGPRYGDAVAFREDPEAVRACVEHVRREGAEEFFRTTGWRRRLRSVLAEARRKGAGSRFETPEEQRRDILEDLSGSKRAIEDRLGGKTVRHFCVPWFRGSALAGALSLEAGYFTNAWGGLLPRFASAPGQPIPLARLPDRYVWRLPGTGRKPLRALLGRRVAGG